VNTKVTVRVFGKEHVIKNLHKVKGEMLDLLAKASNAAGLEIETQAKLGCPVGLAGSLRQHVKNKFRREGNKLMISSVEAKKK
jgi:hypothetical protein